MERTFRPKGSSIKAIQITPETIDYAADWCFGMKAVENGVDLVKVPSFAGTPIVVSMGEYLVRIKGQGFRVMSQEEFEERYEPVKNTRSDA